MKVDGIKILEGLAASGLRSIRYALEVEGTGRVDANDLDSDAVEAMKRNIQYNGPEAEQRMRPLQGDARVIMLQSPLVGTPAGASRCDTSLQQSHTSVLVLICDVNDRIDTGKRIVSDIDSRPVLCLPYWMQPGYMQWLQHCLSS